MSQGSLKIHRWQSTLLYVWMALAAVSFGWGFLSALRPGHSQDFQVIYEWETTWLWQGNSPYLLDTGNVANYPPHAIVALSTLTFLPEYWGSVLWAVLNLALGPLVVYLAFRALKPGAPRKAMLLPCAMFLAWAGLRAGISNGQFTLFMLSMGLLAFLFEEKRPLLGGIFLALALMKPHVGGAFLLWALLTKRWKMLLVASVVMGLGLGIFSLRLAETPFASVRALLGVLRTQFYSESAAGGSTALRIVELRPLVSLFINHEAWASRVHQLVLIVLLGCVGLVAFLRSSLSREQRDAALLQLCSLWLLMSVFHHPYDTILLLPVFVGLWVAAVPHPSEAKRWQDKFMVWVLQLALVVELPTIWWKLSKTTTLNGFDWAGMIFIHIDRLLVLCLFVYVLNRVRLYRLASREQREAGEMLAQPVPDTK